MMYSQEGRGNNDRMGGPNMKDEMLQGRGPEEGISREGSREDSSSGKRKYGDREPESPGHNLEGDGDSAPVAKKERGYYPEMDTDSPSSYPKHVIVPSDRPHEPKHYMPPHTTQLGEDQRLEVTYPPNEAPQGAQVLTPDSVGRGRPNYEYSYRHQQFHDVYRTPSYTPDMDYGRSHHGHPGRGQGHPPPGEHYVRPRRWACDYCNVATFSSYEEACAHEEVCRHRHQHEPPPYQEPYHRHPAPNPAYSHGGPPGPHGSGLGALYHASQEVVTPPTPYHRQPPNRYGSHHAPPLPVLPHEQNYYRQGYYDMREEPSHYPHDPHYHHPPPPQHYQHPHHQYPPDYYQKRLLLALPSDRDSLSDRQCYVRSEMVEIFAATQKDVSARHSKGAQKLVMGQVGIRCVHCAHLRPRDRAERSVCYPKSICRIYQTVADMQRFHFENCREIPDQVRQLYKKLKTTRPRGVGSPQSYWVSSAKTLGLVDTDEGIRFEADMAKEHQEQHQQQPPPSQPKGPGQGQGEEQGREPEPPSQPPAQHHESPSSSTTEPPEPPQNPPKASRPQSQEMSVGSS